MNQYCHIANNSEVKLYNTRLKGLYLGNVLAVVSDKKIPRETGTPDGIIDAYEPAVLNSFDYSPFGVILEGRNFEGEIGGTPVSAYRYGFNGMERDDEVKGSGNSYDFGFRCMDTRLGRFLSIDPLFRSFAYNSTYAYAENRVIDGKDIEGLEHLHISYDLETGDAYVTVLNAEGKLRWDIEVNYEDGSSRTAAHRKTSFNTTVDKFFKSAFKKIRKRTNSGKAHTAFEVGTGPNGELGFYVLKVDGEGKVQKTFQKGYTFTDTKPEWEWREADQTEIVEQGEIHDGPWHGSNDVIDPGEVSSLIDQSEVDWNDRLDSYQNKAKKKNGTLVVGEVTMTVYWTTKKGYEGGEEQRNNIVHAIDWNNSQVPDKTAVENTGNVRMQSVLDNSPDTEATYNYEVSVTMSADYKIVKESKKEGKWQRKK